MIKIRKIGGCIALAALSVCMVMSTPAAAEDGYYEDYYEDDYSSASGDNSLYSLGLANGECSPDFEYSTLEYNVTVPAGTTKLELDPVTSHSDATIVDISGTELDEDGNGTVRITVEAPNGAQVTYTLYVSSSGESSREETTESETLSDEEKELAREEELRKQAESEEALRKEEEQKANAEKLTALQTENSSLTERVAMLMKVLYGLVGFCVVLLFFIINQSLRNKDLKDELNEARDQVDKSYEYARKEQNMQSDYYYATVQGMRQGQQGGGVPMGDVTRNVQATFGNSSQRLQAQPAPGQVMPDMAPVSKKELKKQEKAARKAAKAEAKKQAAEQPEVLTQQPAPQQQVSQQPQMQERPQMQEQPRMPEQPQSQPQQTLVQSTVEEPDVNVDMIDL